MNSEKNEFENKVVDNIIYGSSECIIYFKDNTKFSVFAEEGTDDLSNYPILEYKY